MARASNQKSGPEALALNPANLITLLRIVLVPAFASLMLYHQHAWALGVYGTAALTDLVDGWLARRYGWITALGTFIDPMADKLLQLTAATLLAYQGSAALWVAVALWTREGVVVIGFTVLVLLGVNREVRSSWWGKAGTMAQMFALAGSLCVPAFALDTRPDWVQGIGLFLAAATLLNFLAGLEYAWKGFQMYEQVASKKGRSS
jgi:CDP-diacylglycerol--glycerol-3-phosphate 3-phosphatidyltransferase